MLSRSACWLFSSSSACRSRRAGRFSFSVMVSASWPPNEPSPELIHVGKNIPDPWPSDHGADFLALVPDLADGAILVGLRARHRLAVAGREDVLLLDDRAARLRHLV